jgi:hypothetical protein
MTVDLTKRLGLKALLERGKALLLLLEELRSL